MIGPHHPDRIRRLTGPEARLRRATAAIEAAPDTLTELRRIRRDAVLELRAHGITWADIAEAAGRPDLTYQTVQQWAKPPTTETSQQ